MKKSSLLLFITAFLTLCSCAMPNNSGSGSNVPTPPKEDTYWCGLYQNPLFVTNNSGNFYGSEIADPCVVRGDDGYIYCFATEGRVLRSEDGCLWESYSENIISRPTWGDKYATRPGIWAPDVVKVGDNWIYYYSLSAWGGPCGIGYAVSENVGGPYTDKGMLFTSKEADESLSVGVENSIDPQVFVDDDGSVYMVFGSFVGCYLIRLTNDGMGLFNGVEYQRKNKVLIAGTPGGFDANKKYEGSWIFKKDDVYYYMGSVGSCCAGKNSSYHVLCGFSDNIAGPYYDSEGRPLNETNDEAAGDLVIQTSDDLMTIAPGHNSVIMDDEGEFWWYGHCYYEYDNYATRHLAMDKLLWDDNDMPYIENNQLTYNEELDGPSWLEE